MRSLKLSALALCMAAASAAWAGGPEVVTKEASGQAAIAGSGPAARQTAIDEATKNAKRAAVEQVAGVMIEADTVTANSVLVRDQVVANTAGYIRSYELVGQPKEEGGVITVTIKAQVGAGQIDKDLLAIKAIVKRMGHPKLVLLLQEQTIDDKGTIISSGVMNTVLTEKFKADGWTMVDWNFAAGKMEVGSGVGPAEAKRIGELSKADYILYGQVKFRDQAVDGLLGPAGKGQQNIFPVTGEYDLTFFDTSNGTQMATQSGKMVIPQTEIRQTLLSYERTAYNLARMKGQEITGELGKAVYESIRNAEMNGARLSMSVNGITEFAVMQQFKKVLAEVSGMREVRKGSLAAGKAQYELSFTGTADELAEKLDGKTLKGRKISVTGVTGSTLELTLAK
jgi:hypothetical protein